MEKFAGIPDSVKMSCIAEPEFAEEMSLLEGDAKLFLFREKLSPIAPKESAKIQFALTMFPLEEIVMEATLPAFLEHSACSIPPTSTTLVSLQNLLEPTALSPLNVSLESVPSPVESVSPQEPQPSDFLAVA